MKKILVLQHVPFEILGTLNPLFKQAGFRIRYLNFGRDPNQKTDVTKYDGLVILGGPASVNDRDRIPHLNTEIEMIKQAIDSDIPILGICLGAQLIAAALGAEITRNPQPEIGWYDINRTSLGDIDPLLSNFEKTDKIFQWHNDTFEIPDNCEHLASTDTCKNQAFRYKDNVWGFQFHLEADEDMIKRWLSVPVHIEELQRWKELFNPSKILDQTNYYIQNMKRLSEKTFSVFIDKVQQNA